MYTIIEDCSPYYIRFLAPEQEALKTVCMDIVNATEYNKGYTYQKLDKTVSATLSKIIGPMFQFLKLNTNRISIFVTKPDFYKVPHKDGADFKFGINYMLQVPDQNCVTQWYTDESLRNFFYNQYTDSVFDQTLRLREVHGFYPGAVAPAKSMIAQEGECILFNTDIFHDWHYKGPADPKSKRIALTLRCREGTPITFDDAKQLLFGQTV
jgi:hypothetical protein